VNSRKLIIFEGPDGGGKTTVSQSMAKVFDAERIHLGSFGRVRDGLARLYAEAMMPAVMGHSDVVLDRSWLSEIPYGRAFRNGADRIGTTGRRLLERLAFRCQVVVVLMLPPFEVVAETFRRRSNQEMLDNTDQLREVYDWYENDWKTDLPHIRHDYTVGDDHFMELKEEIEGILSLQRAHPLGTSSAGPIHAPVLVISDGFSRHNDGDTLYQWPFGALSGAGCSRWLARKLDEAGISEASLCWVNSDAADDVLRAMSEEGRSGVVSLGPKAEARLTQLQIRGTSFVHPQAWRRYNGGGAPYPLIDHLKELVA
jgi:thymidylate kinase